MNPENMTKAQLEAYEKGFYTGVMAKENGMYTFSFAVRRCDADGYKFSHPHRSYWMKGWLDAD